MRLIELNIPLRQPFAGGLGEISHRNVVLVGLEDDGMVGWGEAAPYPGVTSDKVGQVWDVLVRQATRILASPVEELCGYMPVTARAAVEQAAWDLRARQAEQPLWSLLGGVDRTVPSCAAIGLQPTPTQTCQQVGKAVDFGVGQVKLKIVPGHDLAHVQAVREQFPQLGVAVDANGTYGLDDPFLEAVDDLDLLYLEQPFHSGALQATAQLCDRLRTPVCLDESAHVVASARKVIEGGFADMVSLKPSLMGVSAFLPAAEAAAAANMQVKVGGLVESSVGRSHALALAMRPEVAASDLVPPAWLLQADVAPDLLPLTAGSLTAPDAPGIGFDFHPDLFPFTTRSLDLPP